MAGDIMVYSWRCPGICLEVLMTTKKIFCQYSRRAVLLRTRKSQIKVYNNAVRLVLDNQTVVQLFYKFSALRGT
jgi:hypothetical protein